MGEDEKVRTMSVEEMEKEEREFVENVVVDSRNNDVGSMGASVVARMMLMMTGVISSHGRVECDCLERALFMMDMMCTYVLAPALRAIKSEAEKTGGEAMRDRLRESAIVEVVGAQERRDGIRRSLIGEGGVEEFLKDMLDENIEVPGDGETKH